MRPSISTEATRRDRRRLAQEKRCVHKKSVHAPHPYHQRFDWLSAKYANGTLNIPIVPPRVAEFATTASSSNPQEATQKGTVDPEIPPTAEAPVEPPPEPIDRTVVRNKNRRFCQCKCGCRNRPFNRHICDSCGRAVCTSQCLVQPKDPEFTWCKWCKTEAEEPQRTYIQRWRPIST